MHHIIPFNDKHILKNKLKKKNEKKERKDNNTNKCNLL